MANQTGIAITIKAFLPTGKTLDEQFAALSIVKAAHESGDYTALLKAAGVEDVKTEQKTRRIEDVVPAPAGEPQLTGSDANEGVGNVDGELNGVEDASGLKGEFDELAIPGEQTAEQTVDGAGEAGEEAVPEFIKKGKAKAA